MGGGEAPVGASKYILSTHQFCSVGQLPIFGGATYIWAQQRRPQWRWPLIKNEVRGGWMEVEGQVSQKIVALSKATLPPPKSLNIYYRMFSECACGKNLAF